MGSCDTPCHNKVSPQLVIQDITMSVIDGQINADWLQIALPSYPTGNVGISSMPAVQNKDVLKHPIIVWLPMIQTLKLLKLQLGRGLAHIVHGSLAQSPRRGDGSSQDRFEQDCPVPAHDLRAAFVLEQRQEPPSCQLWYPLATETHFQDQRIESFGHLHTSMLEDFRTNTI